MLPYDEKSANNQRADESAFFDCFIKGFSYGIIKKYGSNLYHCYRTFVANDSNFDRNPVRGCNYGLEGGAFSI